MDPYTTQSLPGTGGYTPAPARQITAKRRRRGLKTLFQTSRRFRYLSCAAIVALGAVSMPAVSHLLTKPQPQVLEAVRTLAAGHVIAPGDLVAVAGHPQGAALIPAAEKTGLLGHQLRLEVPAGALVALGDFGPFPPTGMSTIPVAVKPGQYPPNLQGGDQVAVFPIPGANSAAATAQTTAHAAATARVVQLQSAADSAGTTVVLLETTIAMAPAIAQAPGVVLVTLDAQADAP